MKTLRPAYITTLRRSLVARLVLLFFAATVLSTFAVGCNTAKGFGKDMERTGQKIQDGTD